MTKTGLLGLKSRILAVVLARSQPTTIIFVVVSTLLIAVVADLSTLSPLTLTTTTIRSHSATGPNVVADGGFENGLGAWELLEPNQTVLLSRELPHNGLSSLELVTEQGTDSTGISVLQRFPNGGCKAFPGLAIETDFELSLWH